MINLFAFFFTFFHLDDRNSLRVSPNSVYDSGEIQNPHSNQFGKDAGPTKNTITKTFILSIRLTTLKAVTITLTFGEYKASKKNKNNYKQGATNN